MNKSIQLDFNNMLADTLGKARGISVSDIENLNKRKVPAYWEELQNRRQKGELPFFDLPYQEKTVRSILKLRNELKGRFENFVVLGIGGSALGNIALQSALNPPFYNLLSKRERGGSPGSSSIPKSVLKRK